MWRFVFQPLQSVPPETFYFRAEMASRRESEQQAGMRGNRRDTALGPAGQDPRIPACHRRGSLSRGKTSDPEALAFIKSGEQTNPFPGLRFSLVDKTAHLFSTRTPAALGCHASASLSVTHSHQHEGKKPGRETPKRGQASYICTYVRAATADDGQSRVTNNGHCFNETR